MPYKPISRRLAILLLALTLLVGCSQPASTPTEPPASLPTSEPAAQASPTMPPTPAATMESGPVEESLPYLDDRSTAASLLASYANAINRREYLRAYSYWDAEAATTFPPFEEFAQGYADTQSVEFVVGDVTGDAGAGQLYSLVPITIHAELTSGARQTFAGCYLLHLGQPAAQATPPFKPLGIQKSNVQEVPAGADPAATMQEACAAFPTGAPLPETTPADASDISADYYLDNRSDASAVLRSLYNAINRGEYLRAYGYWESSPELPPFEVFAQGYEETESVELEVGEPRADAGAGQLYYEVPVLLRATTRSGEQQTFTGCYRLHLSQPAVQATPPFAPLAIESAAIQPVAPGSEVLVPEGCS